jgi:hypothetical protein
MSVIDNSPRAARLTTFSSPCACPLSVRCRSAVDEYRLVVQPVTLGDGLPLFAGPFVLDLVEAKAYADGSVLYIYRPAAG